MAPARAGLAREGVIAASLAHKAAKGVATGPLLEAFLAAPPEEHHFKWAIASAIHAVVTPPDFDRIVELAADRRHGRARQMLARSVLCGSDRRALPSAPGEASSGSASPVSVLRVGPPFKVSP